METLQRLNALKSPTLSFNWPSRKENSIHNLVSAGVVLSYCQLMSAELSCLSQSSWTLFLTWQHLMGLSPGGDLRGWRVSGSQERKQIHDGCKSEEKRSVIRCRKMCRWSHSREWGWRNFCHGSDNEDACWCERCHLSSWDSSARKQNIFLQKSCEEERL